MTKHDPETKDAMERAIMEIEQLRRANEILSAKVEVMELFGLTLRTRPDYGTHGMTEDIAWRMRELLDEMESDRITRAV